MTFACLLGQQTAMSFLQKLHITLTIISKLIWKIFISYYRETIFYVVF